MTVTYEQARETVRGAFEPGWRHGTFCLDDRQITETDEVYAFSVGAREFLVDGDLSYAVEGGIPVVYKADGRLGQLPSVEVATDPTTRITPNPNPTLRLTP
ncbi:hypothetical protein [Flindersiella endophytica]